MISGEQFPNNVQVGEEFYKLSEGEVYRYLGGNPAIPGNWLDIRGNAVLAQISSTQSQLPADLLPHVLTYNEHDVLNNITHAIGDSKVTVQFDGLYIIVLGIQVSRTGGAGVKTADYWLRKNGADISNSGIRSTLTNANDNVVLIDNFLVNLVANDYIEVVQAIDTAGIGLGATVGTALAGGPTIPSIIFSMARLAR
jgi:hypothetical protein